VVTGASDIIRIGELVALSKPTKMTRPPYYSSGGLARGIATTSDSLIRKIG
jgi:hypothetical protein